MTRINQKGFGLVEIILLITIVVSLGLIGYYVYSNAQMDDKTNQTINNADASSPQITEYVNKEFGFKFSYPMPSEGEAPAVYDTTSDVGPLSGKSYSISLDPKFSGGFVTNNFAMAPDKVDEMPLGFSVYDGCKPDDTVLNQVVLYKSKEVCVVINASKELAPGSDKKSLYATMTIQKKFTNNSQIAGLEFVRAPMAIKTSSESNLEAAYGGTMNDDTVSFAKSIQEL
ncbi:MAG TPA: hypothetical protein PKB09_00500 [Candidatus Saccharibacteria bacterium]|nr:hypothetical protein [Candidatus Saccharibacteria bacterium]